jgi:parallel beta-helix repeat protein
MGVFVAALVVSPSAFATSGGMLITTNTTLSEDHYGPIGFGADGVTLDCAGHSVIGPSLPGGGIAVFRRSHVTIRNCNVTGFQYAVSLIEDTSSVVVDNTISNNVVVGLFIAGSEDGTVSGNVVRGNQWGVFVTHLQPEGRSASGNRIEGNTALGNSEGGFYLREADSNHLVGNSSVGNGGAGFSLVAPASGNTLSGNEASGNRDGFYLDSSNGNRIDHNVATNNAASGFALYNSSRNVFAHDVANDNWDGFYAGDSDNNNNTFTKNVANHNQHVGFLLGGTGNNISQCVARANGGLDAFDAGAHAANDWISNNFGSFSDSNP